MTLNEYQELARRTLGSQCDKLYLAVKLQEEAAEAAQPVVKEHYHAKPVDVGHLIDELGDTLWYLATLAHEYGWTLDDVAEYNLLKLSKRHGAQYSGRHYTDSK